MEPAEISAIVPRVTSDEPDAERRDEARVPLSPRVRLSRNHLATRSRAALPRRIRAAANYSPPRRRRIDDSVVRQSVRSRQRDKYRRVSTLFPACVSPLPPSFPSSPPHFTDLLIIRIISRRMRCGSRVACTFLYRVLNCAPARPARYEPLRRSVAFDVYRFSTENDDYGRAIVRGMPLVCPAIPPNFQLAVLREHVCAFA